MFLIITNFKTDRSLENFQEHLFEILRLRKYQMSLQNFFPTSERGYKNDLVKFKVQCLKVFCYHGNKSTILLFYSIFRTTPDVSGKLHFVEIFKSQRSDGFLITKELIFGFHILDLKDHFSASLTKNKTNDLILNLTPENLTLHSRIE